MNSEWSEQIFDSLMEESVTGKHPPDLTDRIVKAWKLEQSATTAPAALVKPPIVAKAPVATSLPNVSPSVSQSNSGQIRIWSGLFAAAAGMLLMLGVCYFAFKNYSGDQQAHGDATTIPTDVLVKDDKASTNTTDIKTTPEKQTPEKQRSNLNPPEQLALDAVPFGTNTADKSTANISAELNSSDLTKLSDREIVELIDTQLTGLWQRLDVVPQEFVQQDVYLQRISTVLTGQQLSATELAEFIKQDPRTQGARVIKAAVDSGAFTRHLAGQLASAWLEGGALRQDSAAATQLQHFVAKSLAEHRPWNEVVESVVGGSDEAGNGFLVAHAGAGNHRLAESIGVHFLNVSIGCARCHDANLKGESVEQAQYWSMVAMLSGLDVALVDDSNSGTKIRTFTDKQTEIFADGKQPSLFFERPDGTLQSADFTMPDGVAWKSAGNSPRAALAHWLADSNQAEIAIVNQIWSLMLGRSLVAPNRLDDIGSQERDDLLKFLSKQLVAHDGDVTKLVQWIASSKTFRCKSIELDRNQWLAASDTELEKMHLAEKSFAAFNAKSTSLSLEDALASAIKWNETHSKNRVLLAQPVPNPNAKATPKVASDVVMPSKSYVLHQGRLTASQKLYLESLLTSSKLSWHQKVEHVVALSPNSNSSGRIERQADELLQFLNDPSATLAEILWASVERGR